MFKLTTLEKYILISIGSCIIFSMFLIVIIFIKNRKNKKTNIYTENTPLITEQNLLTNTNDNIIEIVDEEKNENKEKNKIKIKYNNINVGYEYETTKIKKQIGNKEVEYVENIVIGYDTVEFMKDIQIDTKIIDGIETPIYMNLKTSKMIPIYKMVKKKKIEPIYEEQTIEIKKPICKTDIIYV